MTHDRTSQDMLHGQRALVTGATGGLGKHVVEALLAWGAEVIAVSRRRTRLEELRASQQQHERLEVAECDVSDARGVAALFESVTRRKPLYMVVQASGAFSSSPLAVAKDEDVETLVAANFLGPALVVRHALRHMLPQSNGRIVVVGAAGGSHPAANTAAYGASKAAIAHLVQAAALEAGSKGVRVNAVLPTIIDTPDNRVAMPDAPRDGWVTPQAIAKLILWLAGPEGGALQGGLLRMSG